MADGWRPRERPFAKWVRWLHGSMYLSCTVQFLLFCIWWVAVIVFKRICCCLVQNKCHNSIYQEASAVHSTWGWGAVLPRESSWSGQYLGSSSLFLFLHTTRTRTIRLQLIPLVPFLKIFWNQLVFDPILIYTYLFFFSSLRVDDGLKSDLKIPVWGSEISIRPESCFSLSFAGCCGLRFFFFSRTFSENYKKSKRMQNDILFSSFAFSLRAKLTESANCSISVMFSSVNECLPFSFAKAHFRLMLHFSICFFLMHVCAERVA